MRKTWFATWAAAGMTLGCAGPTTPAAPGGLAASGGAGAVEQASWTEKITAPFKMNPFAAFGGSSSSEETPQVDPAEKPFDPKKATPELYVGLAQMSHRGGDIPQARGLYEKALAKDPNHIEALLGAARMEDREGQLDTALMLYKRAVAAHPRSATALNDLALCHARRGDLAKAQQVLEQATKVEPTKPLYRNNLAKILVETNQLDKATHQLSAVYPPAVGNYNMAVLLSERGRVNESKNYLNAALAIDPKLEPAQALLAQYSAPSIMGVDGQVQPIVQSAPAVGQVAAASNNSILPTPEVLATIPWKPATSAGDSISPAPTQPAEQSPMLLPPVN
ncbi:MAG: tetratricopeptide repeat protein [Pirellulales bacterium]|nr:tetratricopeptide repeat protein [Pirellulales bacterium]